MAPISEKSTQPTATVTYKDGTLVSFFGGESVTLHTKDKQMEEDICINAYDTGAFAYDAFWDSFQLNGNRTNYPYLFAGCGWTDTSYDPKYDIIVTDFATGMFHANTRITSTKVPIVLNCSRDPVDVFRTCTRLANIPSLKVTEYIYSYSGWFTGCKALTEIRFTADSVIQATISFSSSPLLSSDSINSIISVLRDRKGMVAQTMTVHSKVGARMTEAQKAQITAKNWTLVY